MSHDQRPAKMRVVQDAAATAAAARRRGDPATIDAKAELIGTGKAAAPDGVTGAGAETGALPLVSAMLFLLACIAGGVAVALIRPFGLG